MIYFLTDWGLETGNLEADVVFNIIETFNEGNKENTIINMTMSPFLNYFINQYDFSKKENIKDLYDSIFEKNNEEFTPFTMNDLSFPKHYELTYTKDEVLLSVNGKIQAKVFFNVFGFVSHVHYFSEEGKEEHIYSEKGYIIQKNFFNSLEKRIKSQFLDKFGQVILTEWENAVEVGPKYLLRFKQIRYDSLKTVHIEMLNTMLENFDPEQDHLILKGTSDWPLDIVQDFTFPERVVYIFPGDSQNNLDKIVKHEEIIGQSQRVIVDDPILKENIEDNPSTLALNEKTKFLPLFPTGFSLGESNTYAEQYIYWKIDDFNSKVQKRLIEFLNTKLEIPDLCLTIESGKGLEEGRIQTFIENFTTETFEIDLNSMEYGLVQKYYEALENEEMTSSLRELFTKTKKTNPYFGRFIEAYHFIKGVEFRYQSHLSLVKQDLNKARVFVDQQEESDFFIHSLAVSAGIPLVLRKKSPYLVDEKNGLILEDESRLVQVVKNYLENRDSWNQNVVESVEVIQEYSAEGLLQKWKEELQ